MRETIRWRLRELEDAGYLITRQRTGRSSEDSLVADPDGASERFTRGPNDPAPDTPHNREGGTPHRAVGAVPSNGRGPRRRSEGVPPSDRRPTPHKPEAHDDRKGREKEKKEKVDGELALWPVVLNNLKLQMLESTFNLWFADASGRREGDTICVELQNQRALEWVSQRLHLVVSTTVRRVLEDDDLVVEHELAGE